MHVAIVLFDRLMTQAFNIVVFFGFIFTELYNRSENVSALYTS